MGAKLGSNNGPMADINVTPLIDVVLVLLVVFMVITPMLETGKEVALPQAIVGVEVQDLGQFIVVSVTKDDGWFVGAEPVDIDSLIPAINTEFSDHPLAGGKTRQILIKGDRTLPYRAVREVMDLIADNGMKNLLLATDKGA